MVTGEANAYSPLLVGRSGCIRWFYLAAGTPRSESVGLCANNYNESHVQIKQPVHGCSHRELASPLIIPQINYSETASALTGRATNAPPPPHHRVISILI